MKKFVFLTGKELSNAVQELYLNKGEVVVAETSFCEESESDIVIVSKGDSVEKIMFEDLQEELGIHFNVSISHYDEMEVGDYGIGYLFFI